MIKNFYRFSRSFAEQTLPRLLQKTGLSKATSTTIANVLCTGAGLVGTLIGAEMLLAVTTGLPGLIAASTATPLVTALTAVTTAAIFVCLGAGLITNGLGLCGSLVDSEINAFKKFFTKSPRNDAPKAAAPAPGAAPESNVKPVRMLVSATLAFRRAGGPNPQTTAGLEQALASVAATTIEKGYKENSRTVEIAENKIDALKKAVGENYIVEKASSLSINI